MYGLSIISTNWYIKVIWAMVACLQVLDRVSKLNHLVCCGVVSWYFFGRGSAGQYAVRFYEGELNEMQMKGIIVGVFVVLLIFLNVYSNPHPNYKQTSMRDVREGEDVVAKRDVLDE
jgi:hypothetical protein